VVQAAARPHELIAANLISVKSRNCQIGNRRTCSIKVEGNINAGVETDAMSRYSGLMLSHLNQIFNRGTFVGLNDQNLLERFVVECDESAFAALVSRHGPMVLGVCRRILREEHDVEDAFQATFLVLVRRARAIRDSSLLGHWIYGVAYRVAVRARANAVRRHIKEPLDEVDAIVEKSTPSSDSEQRELRAVLDEELTRLPELLRAPLVLCYLEGLTHEEAANQLRWPVGTVHSRLNRAREQLRRRLTRRGFTTDDVALTATAAMQPVPSVLLDATIRMSLSFTARQATATALASATATALSNGVLQTMMMTKLKIVGAATLAGVLALGGMKTYALQFGGSGGTVKAPATRAQSTGGDREEALSRSFAKIQTDLAQSARINAELQTELISLRNELEALRRTGSTPPTQASDRAGNAAGGPAGGGSGGSSFSSSGAGAGMGGRGGAGGGGMGGGPGGMGRGGAERKGTDVRTKNRADGPGGMGGPGGGFGGGAGGMGGAMNAGRGGRGSAGAGLGGWSDVHGANPAAAKDQPRYVQTNQLIVVASPEGDAVTAYSTETGKSKSLRLTDAGDLKHGVDPILSDGLAALCLKGPGITRIAAFSKYDGNWYAQDLREPAEEATPIVGATMAAYPIGRRVYSFSALAKRWDVLELPPGAVATVTLGSDAIVSPHGSHLYVFSSKTGTWEDIDMRAVPAGKDEKGVSN
jgi:RNA polymerase sigma factor (sigma-70 family)